MPRIDIELTSSRPDGTWTWRAAGARQPKGVVDASVLHAGAKVGDVVKAEADFELDGINVTSVLAPKEKKKSGPELLPLLGSGKEEALVTHSPLKPEREDRSRRGDRGDRPDRGERRDRGGFGGPGGRPGGPGTTRPRATPGPGGGPREGGRREGAAPGSRERARPDRPDRPRGDRAERPRGERPAGDRAPRDDRPARERAPRPQSTPPPSRPRPQPKRLQPGRAHREAVLSALPPEQRAIAEQVLRGGLSGVRQAVDEQNAKARAAGGPEIRAEAILSLAEELLPGLRAAEWRDRAEAAVGSVDEISLRDLRTVVAGADAAGRDEESRALASRLREGLERRSAAEKQAWIDEIASCVDEGRVVRALRVSSRAPEQGLRLPPELNTRLTQAVNDAMAPETAPDRWLALLEAVLTAPVRRAIAPKGLPSGADESTLNTIRQAMPKVPALGPLLGEAPSNRPVPPPPPRRPATPPPPPPPAAAAPAVAEEAAPPAEAAAPVEAPGAPPAEPAASPTAPAAPVGPAAPAEPAPPVEAAAAAAEVLEPAQSEPVVSQAPPEPAPTADAPAPPPPLAAAAPGTDEPAPPAQPVPPAEVVAHAEPERTAPQAMAEPAPMAEAAPPAPPAERALTADAPDMQARHEQPAPSPDSVEEPAPGSAPA